MSYEDYDKIWGKWSNDKLYEGNDVKNVTESSETTERGTQAETNKRRRKSK